jgi:hypothetical protein
LNGPAAGAGLNVRIMNELRHIAAEQHMDLP